MRNRTLFWILIFAMPRVLLAQITPPDYGVLYTHDEIPNVYITIDPDSLDALYVQDNDNWMSNHEYQATFVFEIAQSSDTINDIGFRFRGNTSRQAFKKSFKISFNTFVPGRKFHGVEKLNINAEVNDPSMMRSRLYWDLCRYENVAASRSNYVRLYVNGDYFGLYQNIEHIDEEFANTWFGSKKGNLYKCTYPANLQYISSNPDDYKWGNSGQRTYELKTNEELDDYSGLAKFIGFLNQANTADFRCEFADYFDVNSYLKVAAIDVLTGNWDGYIYNQNNFYLYENPLTGKMEYIPYDTDNTWGIDWVGQNWTNRNIYNWSHDGRPLYDRLMDEPKYRNIFSWHIRHLLDTQFNTPVHRQAVENLQDFITAAALADTYRPLDFGYSENDFLNALTQGADGHVPYGVFEYADLREASADIQVENIQIAPIISSIQINFAQAPGNLHITVYADGPDVALTSLAYEINGVGQTSISGEAGTGNSYTFDVSLSENPIDFSYNISLTGTNGLSRNAFCESRSIAFNQPEPAIVINEVLPSNQTGITDEYGEHPDWIELYNAGSSAINLRKFYLSDADNSPLKWNLPDVTVDAGDFLLFYADGSIEQGPLHTNFKIRASGDRIYLFKKDDNVLSMVDKVEMPALISDYSYGRESDGNLPWVIFSQPTPDASNNTMVGLAEIQNAGISVYPNPTREKVYFSQPADYILTDITGRKLQSGTGSQINLEKFSTGSYLLIIHSKVFKIQRY